MVGTSIRSIVSELNAESMRAATLIGLAAIPAGLLWIDGFGTGTPIVPLLAGALVGVLYSDRPTPAQRAGARAGLFAPLPEVTVQMLVSLDELWALTGNVDAALALIVAATLLVYLVGWVIGATVCILVSFVTARVLERARPYLTGPVEPGG